METSLEEERLKDASEVPSQHVEDIANTVKQIEEERSALDSSRKLQEELFSRLREEAGFKAASEMQSRSSYISFVNREKGFRIGSNNAAISEIHFWSLYYKH